MTRKPRVAVAQYTPPPEPAAALDAVRSWIGIAADAGANLVVAPEYASAFRPVMGSWTAEAAEPLEGPFVEGVRQEAERRRVAVIVGFLRRFDDRDARPANTVIAIDSAGNLVLTYAKLHLYDAFGASESAWLRPGADPSPAVGVVDGLRVGVQTCYDLRFPEVSRRLVEASAEMLAVPAEWVAGPRKAQHWRTLVDARAIENIAFVAAADQAAPVAVGASRIVGPRGEELAVLGDAPGLAIATLDLDDLGAARHENPALGLRRFDVVERVARRAGMKPARPEVARAGSAPDA